MYNGFDNKGTKMIGQGRCISPLEKERQLELGKGEWVRWSSIPLPQGLSGPLSTFYLNKMASIYEAIINSTESESVLQKYDRHVGPKALSLKYLEKHYIPH